MTERPDLFAAVVPQVGALDAVRFETTPNGIPNIPEFGSRTTEEGFRVSRAARDDYNVWCRPSLSRPSVVRAK